MTEGRKSFVCSSFCEFLFAFGRSLFFVRSAGANQPVFNRVWGERLEPLIPVNTRALWRNPMMFESILAALAWFGYIQVRWAMRRGR
jgi:hypothetical protein